MDTKLQNALKQANAEVEKTGITDPELKKIAFSKAIDFYLGIKDGLPVANSPDRTQEGSQKVSSESFWANLSNALELEERELKDIYTLKGEQVTLAIRALPGEMKSDKQRNLAALIILAYQEGLGEGEVSSTLLAEAAKHSGIYDTSKFSGNLKSNWFRSSGKKKGLKYKLSGPGVSHAKGLIKTLVSQ